MTYAEKKQLGLCVRCGEKQDEPGLATCSACLEVVNARRHPERRGPVLHRPSVAGTFNVCCQATGFHRRDCKGNP